MTKDIYEIVTVSGVDYELTPAGDFDQSGVAYNVYMNEPVNDQGEYGDTIDLGAYFGTDVSYLVYRDTETGWAYSSDDRQSWDKLDEVFGGREIWERIVRDHEQDTADRYKGMGLEEIRRSEAWR